MPEKKMKITDEQFTNFTGTMFNTPFTQSVSDVPMSEYRQNRLTACFKSEPAVINVKSVTVSPTTANVQVGKTVQLTGAIKPENATNLSYKWVSSNTALATVSSTGLVKGVAAGKVDISFIANDGNVTSVSKITVTAPTNPAT